MSEGIYHCNICGFEWFNEYQDETRCFRCNANDLTWAIDRDTMDRYDA